VSALKSQTGLYVGHWISFGVTLIMMIVVDIMAITSLKNRRKLKPCFRRFGPLILCLLATIFIMAEPTRHVLSDGGVWPLCWQGQIPRINQTWNDGCVASSLEYKCNIPCCVPMDEYEKEYPNNDPPAGTRNESVLDLTDPAWEQHFYYPYCNNSETGVVVDYLNTTTNKYNCDQDNKTSIWKYFQQVECRCDACVQKETMQYLSPVGWIFTVTLTYSGFVLLAVGALWNANIVKKLKKLSEKCRELKEAKKRNDPEDSKAKASVSGKTDAIEAAEIGSGGFDFGAPAEEDCKD